MEFIIKNTNNNPKLTTYKAKFHHCLSLIREPGVLYGYILSIDSLNTYFEVYNKETNKAFDLDKKINAEILKEYVEYIQRPGQFLLPLELHILAYAFDRRIKFYTYNPFQDIHVRAEDFNKRGKICVGVAFDGHGHFERVNENYLLNQIKIKKEIPESPHISKPLFTPAVIPLPLADYEQDKSVKDEAEESKSVPTKEEQDTVTTAPKILKKKKKSRKSFALSLADFIAEANDGNIDAQHNLGLAYYWGGKEINCSDRSALKTIEINHEKAYKWFEKAAESQRKMVMLDTILV